MTGSRPIEIPIFDLGRQNEKLIDGILNEIRKVVLSGRFILGEAVAELEERLGEMIGGRAIGVGSGTDALYLTIKALDIGAGDEVITSPFTFIAPIETILALGARPVFVDIDPITFNLNPDLIEERITERTRAILPIHLFGLPAAMEPIVSIARQHNLVVIEDCAQAFGARIGDQPVGGFGDAGCFSFFPTKILSCFGDGGMVIVRDPDRAERIRSLRVHGSRKKYYHEEIGVNSRLDALQARILLYKLNFVDEWIRRRREIADHYRKLLKGLPISLPVEPEGYYHVYHQFTIRSPRRDELKRHLAENGIGSTVYYPTPLHLQPVCKDLGYKPGDFPEAERACSEVLSLPIFPELTPREVERVASVLSSFDW